MATTAGWCVVILVLGAACSNKNNGGGGDDGMDTIDARVPTLGNANIVHGPSSPTAFAAQVTGPAGPAGAAAGRWIISPDQGRTEILSLTFSTAVPGEVFATELTDCVFTYERAAPALSAIFSCPFEVPPPGAYTSIGLMVSKDFEVLIDDPVNGIYSDPSAPTLFSMTRPTAGPSFVPFAVAFDPSFSFYLSTPLVVAEGATLDLSIVADMTHTTFVNVAAGGAPSFRTDFIPVPMNLQVTPGAVAKAAFYTESGTAENFFLANNYGSSGEPAFVRMFYSAVGEPAYLFSSGQANGQNLCGTQAYNIDPAQSPMYPDGTRAGGFLGLDSTGDLCWAVPVNRDYTTYLALVTMPEVSTVGGTTVMACDMTSTVPPPISGGNYRSGCPAITPDVQGTLTLVAQ